MASSLPRFAALLLLVAPLPGAAPAAFAGEMTTSVSPSWVSTGVFRGQRRSGSALQTVLESAGGDLGAGIWTNLPLEGSGPMAPGAEADLYLFSIRPLPREASVVPGVTLYTYPRASAGFRRATLEPSLALNATVAGVRFTPKISHDLTLRATTWELSATFALALPALGTELDWSASAGSYLRRNEAAGFAAGTRAWGDYWQAGVSVPYQISARTRLLAGWSYAAGAGASIKVGGGPRLADPRTVSRGIVSLGFSSTF